MRASKNPIARSWSTLAAHVVMVVVMLASLAACASRSGTGSGSGSGYVTAARAPMDGMAYGGEADMSKSANDYDYDYKDSLEEAPPAPPTDTTTATGNTTTEPVAQPTPDQPAPASNRKVVYTATLQMSVYELDDAMAFAEALPERYGGWVQSRYEAQVTLRIPADRLQEAMAELGTLGLVVGKTLQAADVTAEFTDLESRLIVLEQMEEQLLALLAQAKTVEESLRVRQELDRVRLELERSRVRMRALSELISFSTLTLYLTPRGPISPEIGSNDPFPWVDELGVEATEYR